MRWRLVVLRKAIFSSEFSSPLYLKTTSRLPTSCVGCSAPLLAPNLRYLLRHTWRRGDSVIQCCPLNPQRRLLTQRDRPTVVHWLPVNEPWANQRKPIPSPFYVQVKERAVSTLAQLLPAQWQCRCGSPPSSTLYCPGRIQKTHAHPATYLLDPPGLSAKTERLMKDSGTLVMVFFPSTGICHLRMEGIDHFGLVSPYYLYNPDPSREALTFPTHS